MFDFQLISFGMQGTIGRALDKPAYCVNYENIWQDTHLFKFLCVSCTKIKISITHLMFFSERNVQNFIFQFLFTH